MTDKSRVCVALMCVHGLSGALFGQMFSNGGLAAASVTLVIAAWLACDNMIALIECAELTGKNSYGQVKYTTIILN